MINKTPFFPNHRFFPFERLKNDNFSGNVGESNRVSRNQKKVYQEKKQMARSASRKSAPAARRRSTKRSAGRKSAPAARRRTMTRRAPMKRTVSSFCSESNSAAACRYTPGCLWKKAPKRNTKICVRRSGAKKGISP